MYLPLSRDYVLKDLPIIGTPICLVLVVLVGLGPYPVLEPEPPLRCICQVLMGGA